MATVLCGTSGYLMAQELVPVTVDNFIRAESDLYFTTIALKKQGGFGKFQHHREMMAIDNQTIIRTNCDTLYSLVVFDLEAGTVTLPDAGDRFMSMQLIDEDMYSPATIYEPGTHRTDWHEVHNPRGAHVGGSE